MRNVTIVVALLGIACLAVPAGADWDETMPYKWLQRPDLTTTGLDVFASTPTILADDFLCTSTDEITDIHIWGSWKNDVLPGSECALEGNPSSVNFRLSIHADIPAGEVAQHSMPGPLLWEAYVPARLVQTRVWASDIQEGWYNPNLPENEGGYIPALPADGGPGDTVCYQYNFILTDYLDDLEVSEILPTGIFQQLGTEQNPIVYWLDVQATPIDPETGLADPAEFGWKTSLEHWNDDATWIDELNYTGGLPDPDPWNELRYPVGHPLEGESIDLAFVITPEPATMTLLAVGAVALLRRRNR